MRRLSLLLKLPVLIVATVLLTAGASSLLAIFLGRVALREGKVEENRDSMRFYADALTLYLDNARSLLETVAAAPGLPRVPRTQSGSRRRPGLPLARSAPEREIAARMLRHSKVFEYVMLLPPDGSVYLMEPNELEGKLSRRDLSYTGWYKTVMRDRQTVVSDLHISPATQRPTVVIAAPVQGTDGQVRAIWAGGLRLEQLSLLGGGGKDPTRAERFGYVTDRRGLIIAHQAGGKYVLEQTDFSAVPPVRAALAGEQGVQQFFSPIRLEEMLGAYAPLPDAGWAVLYVTPTRVADAPMDSLTRNIVLASTGLAVLLGLLGLGVVRRIVGPLGQLTAAAQAFGSGNFGQRIEVQTGDEIETLADEFNRMADSLSEKEEQLRQRAEQLEAANTELEAFTYSVSHDLRAPLRAMDGFSRILLEEHGPQLDPEARRYLSIVQDNTRQMGHLVDDLLALSRLGRQAVKKEAVATGIVVGQALEDLLAEQEGRHLEVSVGHLPPCQADPTQLMQVFVNLLSNALKFTRHRDPAVIEIGSTTIADCKLQIADLPDSPVQSATQNVKSAIYFVRDNGVGFDMQYVDKLFGVFQRLHRAEEYEGTGVGLAIVQRIILRHGGRIWAEAEVDKGATFYFTLGN